MYQLGGVRVSFRGCTTISGLKYWRPPYRSAFQKSLPPSRLTAKAEQQDSAGRILPFNVFFSVVTLLI